MTSGKIHVGVDGWTYEPWRGVFYPQKGTVLRHKNMRTILVVSACAFLLSGCDLVRLMLPKKGTTATEVKAVMTRCGILADAISWQVLSDGTFAYGRKSADAPPLPSGQNECLSHWTSENRIKVAFIGWETYGER